MNGRSITKQDLVGVWREHHRDVVLVDGSVKPGERRQSQIIYSADGFMSVVTVPADAQTAGESPRPMPLRRWMPRFLRPRRPLPPVAYAYSGNYRVIADEVHHKVFAGVEPYRAGRTLVRRIAFSGDMLILSTPANESGACLRIHWQRVIAS